MKGSIAASICMVNGHVEGDITIKGEDINFTLVQRNGKIAQTRDGLAQSNRFLVRTSGMAASIARASLKDGDAISVCGRICSQLDGNYVLLATRIDNFSEFLDLDEEDDPR